MPTGDTLEGHVTDESLSLPEAHDDHMSWVRTRMTSIPT